MKNEIKTKEKYWIINEIKMQSRGPVIFPNFIPIVKNEKYKIFNKDIK